MYGLKEKGITLIALIITIIVLLILAGITLNLVLGENGILKQLSNAQEENIKAQIKEEIELTIADIQMEEIGKGNDLTLETIKNELPNRLEGITAELADPGIVGEYKEHQYTIDNQFNVIVGESIDKLAPQVTIEILNKDYTFTQPVQIRIQATSIDSTITQIQAPQEAVLVNDISDSEKVYEVQKGGDHNFIIIEANGRNTTAIAKVTNLLDAPKISIQEVKEDGFKIQVESNYPAGVITEYKYYVENELKNEGTTDTSYVVTGLENDTEYRNIKVVAYINSESQESNIETTTTDGNWSQTYQTTSDYTDEYGNVAKIPQGFQVSGKIGEKNITQGLVVRDATTKNEFVWIPVGKIYTDTARTEENAKTIELDRYTFNDNVNTSDYGTPIHQGGNLLNTYYVEQQTSSYGNATAKNINEFITSVNNNKGYYIGRYEAGDAESTSMRTTLSSQTNAMVVRKNQIPYNCITQVNAATLCQNLYAENSPIISDLMNSYAWDTAIVFEQEFDTREDKSRPYSKYGVAQVTEPIKTGTLDKICNVFNMASNVFEWSTETCQWPTSRTCRGGDYEATLNTSTNKFNYHTETRYNWAEGPYRTTGFRPLLYF